VKLIREEEKKLRIVLKAESAGIKEYVLSPRARAVPPNRCLSGAAGLPELRPSSRPHADAAWVNPPNSRGRENHPRSRPCRRSAAPRCARAECLLSSKFCAASLDSIFGGNLTHSAGRTGSLAKARENTASSLFGVGREVSPGDPAPSRRRMHGGTESRRAWPLSSSKPPKARLYKGQAQLAIIAASRHGLLSLAFSGYGTCPRGTAPTFRTLAGYPRETATSQKTLASMAGTISAYEGTWATLRLRQEVIVMRRRDLLGSERRFHAAP
jgi:hypothetical protein